MIEPSSRIGSIVRCFVIREAVRSTIVSNLETLFASAHNFSSFALRPCQ